MCIDIILCNGIRTCIQNLFVTGDVTEVTSATHAVTTADVLRGMEVAVEDLCPNNDVSDLTSPLAIKSSICFLFQ